MVTLNLTRLVSHCLIAGATLQCCLLLTWHSVPQTLVGRQTHLGLLKMQIDLATLLVTIAKHLIEAT